MVQAPGPSDPGTHQACYRHLRVLILAVLTAPRPLPGCLAPGRNPSFRFNVTSSKGPSPTTLSETATAPTRPPLGHSAVSFSSGCSPPSEVIIHLTRSLTAPPPSCTCTLQTNKGLVLSHLAHNRCSVNMLNKHIHIHTAAATYMLLPPIRKYDRHTPHAAFHATSGAASPQEPHAHEPLPRSGLKSPVQRLGGPCSQNSVHSQLAASLVLISSRYRSSPGRQELEPQTFNLQSPSRSPACPDHPGFLGAQRS